MYVCCGPYGASNPSTRLSSYIKDTEIRKQGQTKIVLIKYSQNLLTKWNENKINTLLLPRYFPTMCLPQIQP